MPAPIVSATAQATALAGCSNLFAQILDHWRNGEAFSFSFGDLFRFLIVTVLTAPPNFVWQAYLERSFPGRKPSEDHDIHLAERGNGHEGSSRSSGLLDPVDEKEHTLRGADMRGHYAGSSLDWKNTMIKWFIDCMTVGALANTVVFLFIMGVLKGKSMGEIGGAIGADTIPIIVAGYKIWPIASVISFTLIPVERRIVFLSAVGLIWGVYMSLVAARQ